MSSETILSKWNELKGLVEALEVDVAKNVKGVAAAGVRVRKGLRQLATSSKDLVKLTLENDKSKKSEDWLVGLCFMSRHQLTVLRQLALEGIDPSKPFYFSDGKFIQLQQAVVSVETASITKDEKSSNDDNSEIEKTAQYKLESLEQNEQSTAKVTKKKVKSKE